MWNQTIRRAARAALAGLSALCTASIAAAESAEPLAVIERFGQGLETYSARFTQQVFDDNGLLVEESAGTMALSVPDRLCWRYTEPFEQWIIADGEKLWTWDVDLEQVTVKSQAEGAGDSPLYLLMAPERIADSYRLVDGGSHEGLAAIGLVPVAPRADFEWLELSFRDNLLERLVIQDAFGQQTVIALEGGQRNPQVAPSTFTFEPPEGVDVLGAEELSLEGLAEP